MLVAKMYSLSVSFCSAILCHLAVLYVGQVSVTAAADSRKQRVVLDNSFVSRSWGLLPKQLALSHSVLRQIRGGGESTPTRYGRISVDEYRLTPEQVEQFHRDGCVTLPDVLTEAEVTEIEQVFDGFMTGAIPPPPGKDFCDMSKPFGIPEEEWSIVNCMLPTRYYPPLEGNVYERLAANIAMQLFPASDMIKDYDQLLNKRPGKQDAVFPFHQDSAYWPLPEALNVSRTETCTFSLAIDDSDGSNGCLRYVAGSGAAKQLWPHRPLAKSRDEGHALVVDVDESVHDVRLAPAKRGSVTVHDEWVVHGSAGNTCPDRQRRTYVVAFRAREIVEAERRIGFTHSHNDKVNWDTFNDGASHRVNKEN